MKNIEQSPPALEAPSFKQIVKKAGGLALGLDKARSFTGIELPEPMHDEFGGEASDVFVVETGDYKKIDVIGQPLEDTVVDTRPVRTFYLFPKQKGHKYSVRVNNTLLEDDRRIPQLDTHLADPVNRSTVDSILDQLIEKPA